MRIVHSTLRDATTPYTGRYQQAKKEPTAQIAHLVFCRHESQRKKTKRAIFYQRSPRIMRIEI
jgi:hypothetical protein